MSKPLWPNISKLIKRKYDKKNMLCKVNIGFGTITFETPVSMGVKND